MPALTRTRKSFFLLCLTLSLSSYQSFQFPKLVGSAIKIEKHASDTLVNAVDTDAIVYTVTRAHHPLPHPSSQGNCKIRLNKTKNNSILTVSIPSHNKMIKILNYNENKRIEICITIKN